MTDTLKEQLAKIKPALERSDKADKPCYSIKDYQGAVYAKHVDHREAMVTLAKHPQAFVECHGGARMTPALRCPKLGLWTE